MVKVIIDNTVLTNFALVKREDILLKIFGDTLYISDEVFQELKRGEERNVLPKRNWEWLKQLRIESDQERHLFERIVQRLGSGESSCLTLAVNRNMNILTDDLDTRRYAQRLGISVSGTIGVLVLAIKKKIVDLKEGNKLLSEMIEKGYYSPYQVLDELASNLH